MRDRNTSWRLGKVLHDVAGTRDHGVSHRDTQVVRIEKRNVPTRCHGLRDIWPVARLLDHHVLNLFYIYNVLGSFIVCIMCVRCFVFCLISLFLFVLTQQLVAIAAELAR